MTDQNPSYYAVIPANVRYDAKLSANAKLLYGELTALSNKKGFCWASNDYFARLYGTHKKTVSRWISELNELGYIRIQVIDDAKDGKARKIYIAEPVESEDGEGIRKIAPTPPTEQKRGEGGSENAPTSPQKCSEGIRENADHNITVNNTPNTTTNTAGDGGSEIREQKLTDAGALPWFIRHYWGDQGIIPQIVLKNQLMPVLADIGLEEMEICIKLVTAASRDKWGVGYLLGIIKNRKADRIKAALEQSTGTKNGEMGHVDFKCDNCGYEAAMRVSDLIKGRGRSFPCTECGTLHMTDRYLQGIA